MIGKMDSQETESARIRRLISMSTTDIAADIRKELKMQLPGWVFSVRCPHYGAIDISLISGPRQIFTRDYTESLLTGEKYPINGHLDIGNHFNPNWDNSITSVLTREAANILSKVFSICDRYNWDHSDLQSDYYDVHFYLSVEIGRWNKPYIVK